MRDIRASDVMNAQVLAVRPDLTLAQVAAFLTRNEITGAPVVDASGRLVGVVSLTDIAQSDSDEGRAGAADRRVSDIMTPTAYTISARTPVWRVARTMIAGRVHRLLVVRGRRVVGIVTSLDLLKLLADGGPPPRGRRARPSSRISR
jgi:CBS domain-containing protein